MSLRFIFGRAGSGKSYFCINEIKRKIENFPDENSKKLVLLIPEQFSFQSERNLINSIGEKYNTRVQVLSFTRMAYEVFNEVGGITHKHMNSAGKNMLIYKVIDEVKNELKVYSKAGKQQGFVNIMGEAITELKRYDIDTGDLSSIISGLKEEEPLKDKLSDINIIFNRFESKLHENYIDTEDELSMLREKLDKCHIFDGAEVWIDEFSSFTPLQYGIIEKLLTKCERINITLDTDCLIGDDSIQSTDIFLPIKNTEKRILKLIRDNNVSYEKPVCLDKEPLYRFKDSKELSHLEKHYSHYPFVSYEGDNKDISIFKALNMYSEVQNIAKDIIRLCRDKSLRFNDIAVVTGNLKSYENLVQAIFSEYQIPYFIDRKRDINGNPLIILLNSVVDIFVRNWSYEAMFRYLRTGLSGLMNEEIDIIENYVLANGIRGNRWKEEKWDYKLKYDLQDGSLSEKEKSSIEKINEIKNRITKPLTDLEEKVKNKGKVRDICTAIYEFLDSISAYEKIEDWVIEFKKSGRLDSANEYSQIWNIAMELFDQMVEVMGEEKVKLDEFVRILSIGINEYKIGVIPPSLDQVLVSSIERVKSHDVSALFIIGVNDNVFPRVISDEGILNDRDREELRRLGVELASDSKSKVFEEQFLVYTSLTLASKYLKVSYPMADFEGKTLRPSILISMLKKIFPSIIEESDVIKSDDCESTINQIVGSKSTFDEMIAAIRAKSEGRDISDIWSAVYGWYMERPEWEEKLKKTLKGLYYSNQEGHVRPDKIRKLYGTPLQFSVSRLEKYAECPFAYYIQYGLKAKDRKVYEFTSPDLGSFIHEILEEFSNVLSKEQMTWREIDKDWYDDAISIIIDDKIKEKSGSILNSSARYKYMTERLKRMLVRSVGLIAEHVKRSGFNPVGYEMSFSKNGDFPPIVITLPSGENVELIGRIDRVDELATDDGVYLRIVDYKSGNKSFRLSDIYYGLELQLLVYLDAILSNAEDYIKRGVLPGAMLYFKIDNPIVNTKKEIPDEEVEKEIMRTLKMKGLLLKDTKIIRAMDNTIDGYSLIIPAQLVNKGEDVGEKSSVATLEQFELLREYARHIIVDLCEEMLTGNISIKPYKKKDSTPCSFCKFSPICQFDTKLKDNKYKIIHDKDVEEVWELIRKEVEKEVK